LMSVTMEDIQRRRRMCSEKSRFATEVEAKCFVLKKKAKLRAYQCPHCNDWHLTKRLTPPCAAEGGSMQTSYTPPLGRPISTPPMPNGHVPEAKVRRPLATINAAGVVDDYVAGLQWKEIAKRRDCNVWHIAEIIKAAGLKKRNAKVAPKIAEAVPPAKPQRLPGENQQQYAHRVIAWKRATDPEYAARVRRNLRQGQLRRAAKARRAKAFAPETVVPIVAATAPPLTLWQRIKRWFA
jgi:hypothetical protein